VIGFRSLNCVGVVVWIFVLNSCASDGHKIDSELGQDGNPVWVSSGSQSITNNNKRFFQGVGKATFAGDLSKQTSMADMRAKAQINELLSAYIKTVSRNYIASGRAQESGFDHYQASKQITTISNNNMPSAKVIGHWRDKKNNIIYSIAELDLSTVKTTIKPGLINSGFISYFNNEADSIFDGLSH